MKKKLFMGLLLVTIGIISFQSIEIVNADTNTDFTEQPTLSTTAEGAISVYAADLDNDGDMDVLSASYLDDTIAWYMNNGDGTFTEQTAISTTAGGAWDVYAADLDNDGDMDVLSASYYDDTIAWYMNNGDGTFTEQTAISTTADGARNVYPADLDNDGDIDVLSASSLDDTIAWYMNNGDGTFTEQTAISTTAGGAWDVYAADLDNDGDMDVLSAGFSDNTIAWYMNNGDGTFTEQTAISTTEVGARSVYAADLDNDGDMDVLSASYWDNTIAWYMNNGDGTFTEQTAISTTAGGPWDVYAADLDNDGDIDVLSASGNDEKIAWYMNNGDGTFTEQTAISTPPDGVHSVYAADLDNDGDMDVLSASISNDTIDWYENSFISKYTVEFVDYDGTVLQTADYDYEADLSGVTPPTDSSRTGYTFDAWSGTVPATMGTDKVTVTATYTINQYTVEYVDHDGTVLQTADYDYNVDLSGVSAPTNPTRTGYTFDAWSGTVPATMGTDKVTVTATYTINQYTATFKDHDGTVISTSTVDYLTSATAPTNPTRVEYIFDSWDVAYNSMTANIDVTATYISDSYTVTYNVDGVITTEIVNYLGTLTNIPTTVKDGYTFVEWQVAGFTSDPSSYIQGTTEATFIAVFIDSTIPVITGVEAEEVYMSEAVSFIPQTATVTDNVDNDLEATISYFKADGTTALSNLAEAILELEVGNNIVLNYNATDSESNDALEIIITITVIDDIAPVITGVEDEEIFEKDSEVSITFNEGTATLNGEEYITGTSITETGEYTLVVTDASGNITTMTFEIEGGNTFLIISISLIILLIAGGAYITKRFDLW